MAQRNFMELLAGRWAEGKSVCVGLDSKESALPVDDHGIIPVETFNRRIVEATHDLVCAYKPNLAFYPKDSGKFILRRTIDLIKKIAPNVPVILDAKVGDIGNTNDGYVEDAFEFFGADAITVHNYMGREAMQPFLARKEKGVFVLCKTSNPGAAEFQDVDIELSAANRICKKMYEVVAGNVSTKWNTHHNCGLVVGATYPEELARVRSIVGDMPILIPGIGAQGGDVEKTVHAGKNSRGNGMIINSSRGIIFASHGMDYAEAARRETQKLHGSIAALLLQDA